MNTSAITTVESAASESSDVTAPSGIGTAIRRLPGCLAHWTIGSLLCFFSPLTAVLAIGWTYRFARRAALKYWFKRSPIGAGGKQFRDFLAAQGSLREFEAWPQWMRRRGLIVNARVGIGGWLATFAVLALPGFAMMFAWWSGWENSFSKGYEQFSVGSVTSLLAILVFIVLMFYVPLAQARQAVTGETRRFFDVPTVLRLTRDRWFAYLMLVAAYAILAVPLFLAASFLGVAVTNGSALADLTPKQGLRFLNVYYLAWSGYLFAAYVLLHWIGARIYASAVLSRFRTGRTGNATLTAFERNAFEILHITSQPPSQPHVLVRTAIRGGRCVAVFATVIVTGVLWFSLIAQLYTTQFFAAQPMVKIETADSGGFGRWMNHPLIQVPHVRHIPHHLEEAAKR